MQLQTLRQINALPVRRTEPRHPAPRSSQLAMRHAVAVLGTVLLITTPMLM